MESLQIQGSLYARDTAEEGPSNVSVGRYYRYSVLADPHIWVSDSSEAKNDIGITVMTTPVRHNTDDFK